MNGVVTHNNKIDVTSGVTVVSSSESATMNVVVTHNNKIDVTSGVAVVPSSKFATTLTTILVATGIVLGYQNIEVPITEPITEPVTVDTGVNVDFVHQYAYSDTVHVMGHVSPDTGHKIQLNHTDVLTITSGVETFIYEIPDTVEDIEVTSNIEAADGVTVEIDEPADTVSVYGQVTAVGMQKGSTRGRIAYYKDGRTDKLHYVIGMLNDTPVLGYGLRIGINNLPNDIDVDSGVEVVRGLPIIDDLTTDVTVTGIVDVAPPIVKATADWVDVDVYSNVDAVLKPELDVVYDSNIAVMSSSDFEYGHDHYIARTEYVDVLTDVGIMYTPPIIDTELIDVVSAVDAVWLHYNGGSYEWIFITSVLESVHTPTALYDDVLEQISVTTGVVSVTIVLTPTDTDDIVVTSGVDTFFINPVESVNDAVVVTSGTDVLFITPITHVDTVETSSKVTADFIEINVDNDEVITVDSGTDVQVFAPIVYESIVTTLTGIDHSYGKDNYIERTESLTTSTGIDVAPTPPYEDDVVVTVSSVIDVTYEDDSNVEDMHIIDTTSGIDTIVFAPVEDVAVIDTYTGIDIHYGIDSYLERTEVVTVSSAIDLMYILSTVSEVVIDVLSQVAVVTQDLIHTSTDTIDVSDAIALMENTDILPTTVEIAVNSGIDTHVIGAYDDATLIDVYSNVDVDVVDTDVEIDVDVIVTSSAIGVTVLPPVEHIDIVDILSGTDIQYGIDSYLERTDVITISSVIDLEYGLNTDIIEAIDITSQVLVEVTDLDTIVVDTVDVNTSIAFIENRDMVPATIDITVDSGVTTHIISSYNSDTVVVVDSNVDAQVIDNNIDAITDNVEVYSIVDVMVTPPVDHIDTVDTLSGIDIHYGDDHYLERTDAITVSGAVGIMYVLNTADDSDINVISQVLVEAIDLNHTSTDNIDVDTSITLMENTYMYPVTETVTVNSGIDVLIISPYSGDNVVDVDSNIIVQTIDIDVDAVTDSIITSSTVGVATLPPVGHIDTVSVLSGIDTQYGVDSYLERTEVVTVSSAIGVQVFVPISASDTVTVATAIGLGYQPIISSSDEVINVATQLLPMVIAVYDDTVNIAVSSGVNPAAGSNNTVTHSDAVNVIAAVNSVQGLNETVSTDTDVVVSSVVALELRLTTSTSDTVAVASGIAVEIHTMVAGIADTINVTSGIGIHTPIDLNVPTTDTVSVVTQLNPMIVLNITDTQTINVTSVVGVAWGSALSSSDVVTASSGMDMQVGVNSYIERTDTVTATSGIGYTIQPPLTSTDTVVVTSGIDAVVKPQHVVSSTDSVAATTAISVEAYAPFNITLDKQSGAGGTSSITGLYSKSITPTSVSVPSRTGYTFQGYYTATSGGTQRINASGTYVALTNTTYSGNVTLYAQWTSNTYTITLDKQSGTGGTSSITSVYGTSLTPTSVTVPTRAGYDFVGYYNSTSGGTQRINASGTYVDLTSTTYSTNATLYARWALGTFSITLNQGGGSGASLVSSTYTHSTSYQTIPFAVYQSSRTGYTFQGWDVKWADGNNSEGKVAGQLISNGGIDLGELHLMQGVWGNLILEAVWSSNTYTITLNMNGGSGGTSSITSVYGTSLTPTSVSVPNRTGYNFAGYYTASSGGTQRINSSGTYVALTSTTYTSNATLYARWTRKTYTITLNKQSGTGGTNSIAGEYGLSLTPASVTVPTRSGHTFQGYYTAISGGTQRINASGTYVALTSTTYSANTTLYARWELLPTQTATPTVGEPYCRNNKGSNQLIVSVTNNDTSSATIKRGTITLGTLAAGATTTYTLYTGFSIPYSYTVSITATATGKPESNTVVKSGSVSLCPIQGI